MQLPFGACTVKKDGQKNWKITYTSTVSTVIYSRLTKHGAASEKENFSAQSNPNDKDFWTVERAKICVMQLRYNTGFLDQYEGNTKS